MDGLISVIVTTYNWPDALNLVLKSLMHQTDRNFEIVVADDGSTQETAELIAAWKDKSPIPLIHSWQEDKGFRAARSRNAAVSRSRGEYLVFLDGDCVVRPDFIASHRRLAQKNCVLAGQRILVSESFTQECFAKEDIAWCESLGALIRLTTQKKINRWQQAVSLPLGFVRAIRPQQWQMFRTCNGSLFRENYLAVQGLDEAFEGWGYEDSDLAIRLINSGCRMKWAGFTSPCFHLWHRNADRAMSQENLARLEGLKSSKTVLPTKPMQQSYDV